MRVDREHGKHCLHPGRGCKRLLHHTEFCGFDLASTGMCTSASWVATRGDDAPPFSGKGCDLARTSPERTGS